MQFSFLYIEHVVQCSYSSHFHRTCCVVFKQFSFLYIEHVVQCSYSSHFHKTCCLVFIQFSFPQNMLFSVHTALIFLEHQFNVFINLISLEQIVQCSIYLFFIIYALQLYNNSDCWFRPILLLFNAKDVSQISNLIIRLVDQ